jgi:hypothetical protein
LPGFASRFWRALSRDRRTGSAQGISWRLLFPSCASWVCSRSQALTAGDWTAFQSPSGNVLDAPKSRQVSVRSCMGLSIRRHPGLATVPPSPPRGCLALLHAVIVPAGQAQRVSPMTRHPMSPGRRRQQTR